MPLESELPDAERHDVGPLAEGWRYQRDSPAWAGRWDADELRTALGQAKRHAEMS